jgi:hypothetical protein
MDITARYGSPLNRWAAAAVALTTVALAGAAPASADAVRLPPATGVFDYQLGGAYGLPGLTVVTRDAAEQPLPGAYNVCYVNGFQTQPGDGADWLSRRPAAVLRDGAGTPVVDPDWPDEYVLDPSTPDRRATILEAVRPVITGCADRGFDAVEVDNLDTYTRFGQISQTGALDLAASYASLAHGLGLAIGQKNAAEIAGTGRAQLGFDFAVAEECAAFDECAAYQRAYGAHVLQIEYADNLPTAFGAVCDAPGRAPLTILRDRDLVPAGAPGHVYQQCPPTPGS